MFLHRHFRLLHNASPFMNIAILCNYCAKKIDFKNVLMKCF